MKKKKRRSRKKTANLNRVQAKKTNKVFLYMFIALFGGLFFLAIYFARTYTNLEESVKNTQADSRGTVTKDTLDFKFTPIARWYTAEQVKNGSTIFFQNCAVCHGAKAQGLSADYRIPLADGSYPPPPLNGSAHAWHHPLNVLLDVIENGNAQRGGKMPSFKDRLSKEQRLEVIAYFQDFWGDNIYGNWARMNN